MSHFLNQTSKALLTLSFYLLFFFVPLFFLPFNFELFEFNKMTAVYFLASIILGAWLMKSITGKKFQLARTPLDIPILLFLASQVLSTVFSIDRHVSIFGYYSRFNGGLLSISTYIFLYYAFVSNFTKEQTLTLIKTSFLSGSVVAFWGILEHFGHSLSCLFVAGNFDVSCWVQDVKTRVFATLGQPNWLAAYMAVLIPLALGTGLEYWASQNLKGKSQKYNLKVKSIIYIILSLIFFATLLFTKSKSGLIGISVSLIFLFVLLILKFKKQILIPLLFFSFSLFLLIFLFGTSIESLDRFTLPHLIQQPTTYNLQPTTNSPPPPEGLLESGVTGSDEIRRIVWKGAFDIFKAYPVLGSGVETFAFSYYQFRPVEHNQTSEWDFLYNKAHNEYLNYLANTGAVGIITYLIFILAVGMVFVFRIKNYELSTLSSDSYFLILTSLFCGWFSILITNFFGFSVVIVQLFFYLIPAMMMVLNSSCKKFEIKFPDSSSSSYLSLFLFSFLPFFLSSSLTLFLLFSVFRGWFADFYYADGYHASRGGEYTKSYDSLKKALSLNSLEPVYYDEFSYAAATVAIGLSEEKDKTLSNELTKEAILTSDTAIEMSPFNVNFWKSRTRVFYTLAQIDSNYLDTALLAMEKSSELSPTDAKVRYNLALIYDSKDQKEKAIQEMEEAVRLKPDYREAYIAAALLYSKYGDNKKASAAAQFVLDTIDPDDPDAKKVIEDLKK